MEYNDRKNKSERILNNNIDLNANANINTQLNNQLTNNNDFNNNENIFLIPNTDKKQENSDEKDTENENQVNFNLYSFIRIFLVVIMISFVSLNTVYGFALPHGNIQCIEDRLFILTENINKYFYNNAAARKFLLIVSSFCVDFSMLYMMVIWCLWGKSWRIIGALFCFYSLRGIIQVNSI